MSDQRLRVAVVGAGGWGEQHARIFARRPDTELVAIVGRTPERAEARAAAYGTTAYTDLEEMLTRARPDLVTTCLPNEEHFAPTLELIRHNVPLLVEKPFVFSVAEADQLLAEACSSPSTSTIATPRPSSAPTRRSRPGSWARSST
jgi:predicted dehydrogenase